MHLPAPGGVHDEAEIEAVVACLRSGQLDIAENVVALEAGVAELLSKDHGVMVNSGSSALRLAIDLLDVGPGDEIITSPLTFSTDIAPMVQSNVVPVFVDIEPTTYQIDVGGMEEMIGPRTKAILVPNLCGNVPDWDAIWSIADRHGLTVVEDSCDVLDSWLGDERTGTCSDISVTSFARTHAITAGGNGGMVGIDDDELHDRCLSLRRWGRRSESYLFGSRKGQQAQLGELADGTPYDPVFLFDSLGYNFEPSELGAAYGLVQLGKLERFNAIRRANRQRLVDFFADRGGVTSGTTTEGARTTWMRFCMALDDDAPFTRAELQRFLIERDVPTRMVWTGNILRQPGFAEIEHRAPAGGLPNCDRVMDRSVSLPIHHGLQPEHLDHIVEQLDALYAAFT